MINKIWKICRIPAAVLIALLPLFWSLLSGDKGFAHPESSLFLVHYNSDAPLLKLIFDPLRTDWGLYQARELSYLTDMLDAKFIAWCISHKNAHFLSLSSIIFFVSTVFTQVFFTAKCFPKLKWGIALLPSLLFSCAYASSNHTFYRSSKPAVTFLLTLLLFSVIDLVHNHTTSGEKKKFSLILAASALILMPLFDRQGFFFVGIFTTILILLYAASAWKIEKNPFDLPGTLPELLKCLSFWGVLSLAISTCWNIFIAPEIIMALNGYYPSFEYQQLPIRACFNFSGGTAFFFRNIGFVFFPFIPNMNGIIGGVILLLSVGYIFFMEYKNHRKPLLTIIFSTFAATGILLGNLMSARHDLLLQGGVLYGIYFLPLLAVLTGFLAILLGNFSSRWNILLIILCVCAISGGIAIKSRLIQPFSQSIDLEFFYKATAPKVIYYLNHPESKKEMPLQLSNSFMIDFFRAKQLREHHRDLMNK